MKNTPPHTPVKRPLPSDNAPLAPSPNLGSPCRRSPQKRGATAGAGAAGGSGGGGADGAAEDEDGFALVAGLLLNVPPILWESKPFVYAVSGVNLGEWPVQPNYDIVRVPTELKGPCLDKPDGEKSAMTALRLAFNKINSPYSVVRTGNARCLPCVNRELRGAACVIGCVSTHLDGNGACAECRVLGVSICGTSKKDWRIARAVEQAGQIQSVQSLLGELAELMMITGAVVPPKHLHTKIKQAIQDLNKPRLFLQGTVSGVARKGTNNVLANLRGQRGKRAGPANGTWGTRVAEDKAEDDDKEVVSGHDKGAGSGAGGSGFESER